MGPQPVTLNFKSLDKNNLPLLLVYTSGTTGKPKGALISQKSVICNAKMSHDAHSLKSSDKALIFLPLFHVGGINILFLPALFIGATTVLQEKFDLEEFKKTPQFYYQGTKDKSNPFRRGAEDLTDEEYEIVKKLFVDGLPFEYEPVSLKVNTAMWNNSQKYIYQIVDNVKFESPKNLNHEITPKMTSKSTEFIKENLK